MTVEGYKFVRLLILLLTFFTQDKGVKLLQIRGSTPDKYALMHCFMMKKWPIIALAPLNQPNHLSRKRGQTLLKV